MVKSSNGGRHRESYIPVELYGKDFLHPGMHFNLAGMRIMKLCIGSMVKEDGFFISWDKANWVRKYRWETE
jgi:hypothetical protein